MDTLKQLSRDFMGERSFNRYISIGGKFYYNMHFPGFPSKIQRRNYLGELHRIIPVKAKHNRLRILFLNITNKCPLQCKHCYEWDNLNKSESLDKDDYKAILAKYTDSGIGQVHFGGGEPLLNYTSLLELIKFLKGKTETWIATSGLGLSYDKAIELKKSGLTGIAISVDHYDAGFHNAFRGSARSFDWAMDATENSLRAELVTCWSICATREFVTKKNLYKYAQFASSKNVHFIQIFEPVPAGRFSGKNVLLDKAQYSVLEKFYLDVNSDKEMKNLPLVTYHGYFQRRLGCMGGGNRYLFIDTAGNVHSCPFCRNGNHISALSESVSTVLMDLEKEHCLLG